jgi:hypothetical protein
MIQVASPEPVTLVDAEWFSSGCPPHQNPCTLALKEVEE